MSWWRDSTYTGSTSDATTLVLTGYQLPESCVARFSIVVEGRSTAGDSYTARLDYSFERDGANDVDDFGTGTQSVHSTYGASGWLVDLVKSGINVVVHVTGSAGKEVKWNIDGDVFITSLV